MEKYSEATDDYM